MGDVRARDLPPKVDVTAFPRDLLAVPAVVSTYGSTAGPPEAVTGSRISTTRSRTAEVGFARFGTESGPSGQRLTLTEDDQYIT